LISKVSNENGLNKIEKNDVSFTSMIRMLCIEVCRNDDNEDKLTYFLPTKKKQIEFRILFVDYLLGG
jgi:hypothetical protein